MIKFKLTINSEIMMTPEVLRLLADHLERHPITVPETEVIITYDFMVYRYPDDHHEPLRPNRKKEEAMPVESEDIRVALTLADRDGVFITFKFNGQLWTLVGLAYGNEDFFIDHKTGEHLYWDPKGSIYSELTDFCNKHELWDV